MGNKRRSHSIHKNIRAHSVVFWYFHFPCKRSFSILRVVLAIAAITNYTQSRQDNIRKHRMANSHTKLNPIYAAIDAYQFNRAIKLASALPDSNVLGKALLAHSYTKAGQKHHALRTLHKILVGGEGTTISSVFFELQSVLTQQNELLAKSAASQSATPPKVEAPSGKKGKKGKKKPVPKVQQQQQRVVEESSSSVDLIDRLDVPPVIPETVDFLPNSSQSTTAKAAAIITDETEIIF